VAGDDRKIEIGRVVQQGFDALSRQTVPYLLLALLLSGVPNGVMNWLLLRSAAGGDTTSASSPLFVLGWLVATLSGYLLQAVIVRSAILQLGGNPPDLAGSVGRAFRLILPMIGLAICSAFLMGVGFLLLVVPGIIVYIALIVSVPALIEEGGVFHSMRRSRELTRGSRGRIFLLLILFLIAYLLAWGVTAAIGAALGVSDDALVQSALQALSVTVITVLGSAMSAALYFELRTVKEGATVQGLAEVFA
jgi:hypothetical protein